MTLMKKFYMCFVSIVINNLWILLRSYIICNKIKLYIIQQRDKKILMTSCIYHHSVSKFVEDQCLHNEQKFNKYIKNQNLQKKNWNTVFTHQIQHLKFLIRL